MSTLRVLGDFSSPGARYAYDTLLGGQSGLIPIEKVRDITTPGVYLSFGHLPICGKDLDSIRGYILEPLPDIYVLCTYPLSRVVAEWELSFIALNDIHKIKAFFTSMRGLPLPNNPQALCQSEYTSDFTVCNSSTVSSILSFLDRAEKADRIAFDLETSRRTQCIHSIGLAIKGEGISIPLYKEGGEEIWSLLDEFRIMEALSRVLSSPVPKVAHNASFDVASLWHNWNMKVNNLEIDTLLQWHCLYAGFDKDLGFLASLVLNVPPWKYLSSSDNEKYNALDAIHTLSIADRLEDRIKANNLTEIFQEEMSQLEPSIFLSLRGIKIDRKKKNELYNTFSTKIKELEANLNLLAETLLTKAIFPEGERINFNSSAQLKELLYVSAQLPVQLNRKSRKMTVDEQALKKLKKVTKGKPINSLIEGIMLYRETIKLRSFVDIELSPSGRVHTSYNIAGTTSGRWSSSKNIILPYGSGNLQQIPSSGFGHVVRSMYIPSEEGKWIVQADFVQAEAVIVAYLIEDEVLIENFKKPEFDLHKWTASMMLKVPIETITPSQRDIGKKVRHALNYMLGANGLSDILDCTPAEAKQYIKMYYDFCPQLASWQASIERQISSIRQLRNPFGRRRMYPGRVSDIVRSGVSFLPQSIVGDLLNKSLVKFYNLYGEEYSLLLQLHDAMYVDSVPDEKVKDCISKLEECMTWEVVINNRTCILRVDFKKGKNWKEMVKI